MDPFFAYIESNKENSSQNLYSESKQGPRYEYDEVTLPHNKLPDVSLAQSLIRRTSALSFDVTDTLDLDILSVVLEYSYGARADRKRTFPSAGNFYSQTLFVSVNNVTGLKSGIYEYNPGRHTLMLVKKCSLSANDIKDAFYYDKFVHAPALLCLVWRKGKNIQKYGSYVYPHAFLEAGHAGQNVYLVAAALGIGCCAMGSGRYSVVNKLLDLSGTAENYIYGIAIGHTT